MKISDGLRQSIIEDFDFAISKMEEAENKGEVLFYFSAFFGGIQRAYNFEFNADLIIAHLVLRTTHEMFHVRIKALSSGGDSNVPLFEEQFTLLIQYSKELRKKVAENKNFDGVLKKLTVLSYSTTGNGFYLYQKGHLKI